MFLKKEVEPEIAEVIEKYRTRNALTDDYRKQAYYPCDEVIPLHDIKISIDSKTYPFKKAIDIDTGKR